jgi:hypothetical protein
MLFSKKSQISNSPHTVSFTRNLIFRIYDQKSASAPFCVWFPAFDNFKKPHNKAKKTMRKKISHLASKA